MKQVQFIDKNGVVFDLSWNVDSILLEFTEQGTSISFCLERHEVAEVMHELLRLKDRNNG
jgi:hypothetical protein